MFQFDKNFEIRKASIEQSLGIKKYENAEDILNKAGAHKQHKYLKIENGKYIYDYDKMTAKDHIKAAELHTNKINPSIQEGKVHEENIMHIREQMIHEQLAHKKGIDPRKGGPKYKSKVDIKNLTQRSGSEGPTHDPYGYTEHSFSKDGKNYIIHLGLAQWIKIDGKKIIATGDDYDNEIQFVSKNVGIKPEDVEDILNVKRDDDEFDDPMGHPSMYM